ncbi:MAG TPA: SDR family oxidoreductase [Candidatus Binataceae bacterium]|jgi:2-dehydro-3-deoxy-D-gluconate 5-dehydrogenase|nr:SDR family oxidoreductase [Candidatus Binataceae bacterium]
MTTNSKAFDLSGKVAAVTGGNRGLGRAIAIGLAEAGASVAILARDESKNASALAALKATGAKAFSRRLDLMKRADLRPAMNEVERELGPIDILVNNAAVAILKGVLDQSEEEWDQVIETNLNGCFLLSKYAAQSMVKRKRGKIINVSSVGGNFGTPIFPSYAVSKGGLMQLTRCLALELAPHNIQVNSLVPGWFTTDMTDWIRNDPTYAAVLKEMVQRTPRGRFGEPAELAGAAVYLASSASDAMTGAELVIDGGFSIR